MCGFVAGLLRDALEPKRLDRALETLHHRGPDTVGRWISPDRCGLAHRPRGSAGPVGSEAVGPAEDGGSAD